MATMWQRELPEAQGSKLNTATNERDLFRTPPFNIRNRASFYQVLVTAAWDDRCKNGANSFLYSEQVVPQGGRVISDYVGMSDVPPDVLAAIPAEYRALEKWSGFQSFGPWYYFENGLFHAGDRDCWGLRKGERKQQKTNKGEPMWNLLAVNTAGVAPYGEPVPLWKLPTLLTGDKPKEQYRLEWFPCYRIGEGKERDLEAFRRAVAWPEATMADIEREDLSEVLKARLPVLLREFRAVIEGLGFTW